MSASSSKSPAVSVAQREDDELQEQQDQEGRGDEGGEVEEMEGADNKEDGVEVGSGLRLALTFSTEDGNIVPVPEEVSEAIGKHVPPKGYEPGNHNSRSFATQWGVFCASSSDASDVRFYCLADNNCRNKKTMRKCTTVKSNATRHLREDHKLRGIRGKTQADTARDVKYGTAAAQAPAMGVSTKRSLELTFMRMLVRHQLPLEHSTTKEFRVLMGLASENTFPNISRIRVKHLVIEMYDATKKALLAGLREEMDAALLNILHFSLDIWTCTTSGKKFLAITIYWVTKKFTLRTALLSAKHYCPAPETSTEKASQCLWKIFQAIIAEVGLTPADFASCTTDSGSDVEAMCVNLACEHYKGVDDLNVRPLEWDWCSAHLVSRACEHAFGTSAAPAQRKDAGARSVINKVTKVVETLHRSSVKMAMFEDIQVDLLRESVNIPEHAPRRWLSMSNTMGRTIWLFPALRVHFAQLKIAFPLDAVLDDILQIYSLMAPCAKIMRVSQSESKAMNGRVYHLLGMLMATTLNPDKPLKVFELPPDPPRAGDGGSTSKKPGNKAGESELSSRSVDHDELTEVGQATRLELRRAMVQRFAGRVFDERTIDPSIFRDAAVVLVPSYNNARLLDAFKLQERDKASVAPNSRQNIPTRGIDVEARIGRVWTEIEERVVEAGIKEAGRIVASGRDAKRLKLAPRAPTKDPSSRPPCVMDDEDEFDAEFGNEQPQEKTSECEVTNNVRAEISRYKALNVPKKILRLEDALTYWGTTGHLAFGLLRHVAQQVFGNQASAAQVERVFSGVGNLLAGRRCRSDAYLVEMLIFLYSNFDSIPNAIPVIARQNITEFIPKRFRGSDNELVEAERLIDPINGESERESLRNFGISQSGEEEDEEEEEKEKEEGDEEGEKKEEDEKDEEGEGVARERGPSGSKGEGKGKRNVQKRRGRTEANAGTTNVAALWAGSASGSGSSEGGRGTEARGGAGNNGGARSQGSQGGRDVVGGREGGDGGVAGDEAV